MTNCGNFCGRGGCRNFSGTDGRDRRERVVLLRHRNLIPITILSGFLGSGKTSVLNYLLQNQQQKKIAVIVNEFGDISMDHQYIQHREEDLVQLANGCICCTVRNGLKDVIRDLADRGPWDGIIIEASGAADPGPLLRTLMDQDMEELVYLDALLTMAHGQQLPEHLEVSVVSRRQLQAADLVILSHRDMASNRQWQQATALVREQNPAAVILPSDRGRVPLQAVLAPSANNGARRTWSETAPVEHSFQSLAVTSAAPLSFYKFRSWLESLPDRGVIRAKGIAVFHRGRRTWYVHLVGRRITCDPASKASATGMESQLVLIGRGIQKQDLEAGFASCIEQQRSRRWPWARRSR